jgi:tetratricopeptide (TPR) repeat protein
MATASEGLPRMVEHFLRCHGLGSGERLARVERLLRAQDVTDAAEWQGLALLMSAGRAADPPLAGPERNGLLRRLLERTSRKRAVVVRLDDAQWGADALAFAEHVLGAADPPVPALFLLTVRDEALATRPLAVARLEALMALPGTSRLTVPPLDEPDRRALVEGILGLRGALASQVVERTGGNPLFAVELVGDWVERGVLEPSDDGFALRQGETAPLPDDLHEVWSRHVDHALAGCASGVHLALEVAAALGRTVDTAEWEAACAAAGVVPDPALVDALTASRLATPTPEGFSLAHEMLRESIERRAREAGRFEAHQLACARAVEGAYRAGVPRAADRYARHLLRAGRAGDAIAPLLRTAAERRETSDYAVAHAWLDRREQALSSLSAPTSDPQWGEGWALRARLFLHEGDVASARASAERTEREATRHGWTDLLSEGLRLSGDAARREGALRRAADLYDRGIALRPRLVSPHGVAASLWGQGDVARQQGRLRQALDCFERSRELYARIGDEHGVADHRIGAADVAWQARRLADAERLYGEAEALFGHLGNRYGIARARNGLGEVARVAGDLDEAARLYREAVALLDLVGSADAAFPRVNLALVALAQGRTEEARAQLVPLGDALAARGWHGLRAVADTALLACGAEEGWTAAFARVRSVLDGEGLVEPDVAWLAERAGLRAAEEGAPAHARAAFELSLAQWTALGHANEVARLRDLLAGS